MLNVNQQHRVGPDPQPGGLEQGTLLVVSANTGILVRAELGPQTRSSKAFHTFNAVLLDCICPRLGKSKFQSGFRFYGLVVTICDSESHNTSSNLGRTSFAAMSRGAYEVLVRVG